MLYVVVYVVLLAEGVGEGQAREVLQPVPVDGVDVEPHDERREEPHVDHQRQRDQNALAVLVERAEGDVGQEGEGEEEPADEAEDVGDVVDPRQQAAEEEEQDDAQQLEEGLPRLLQHLPALEELHEEARQEAELRAGRAHLEEQTEG